MTQEFQISDELKKEIRNYVYQYCSENINSQEITENIINLDIDEFPNLHLELEVHCQISNSRDWGSDPYYESDEYKLDKIEYINVISAYYCGDNGDEFEINIEL